MAIDPWEFILEWWMNYQADPKSDPNKIESGLKRQQIPSDSPQSNVTPATKANLQTGSCQYWVKGLPGVCKHWDPHTRICNFNVNSKKSNLPTGYGLGGCDALGRRSWCSEYKTSKDNINEYVCVLPSIEKSGSGKVIRTDTTLTVEPWLPEDIKGYNPDDNNVGRCDGSGMGRGVEGVGVVFVEDLYILPPVCKHYKPHQLGFGAVVPRPYHGKPPATVWKRGQTYVPKDTGELHDGSAADPLVMMDKHLPFSFLVYNQRALFQKCGHWDADLGGLFYFDDYGADPSYFQIVIEQDAMSYCKKARDGDVTVLPYTTINEEAVDIPWVLYNVWSKAGSVVCNGAKPECPCYTGKWFYCIDKNMQDGMRISANQIFELRFWASDWSSQEEYDKYYAKKPGRSVGGYSDITTADLFTFTKWHKGGFLADDSIMQGNKHHMCMPAPLSNRVFTEEDYVTIEPIIYPKAGQHQGTTDTEHPSFPTLVRELEAADDLHPNLFVVYPYATIDPWEEVICDTEDRPNYCNFNHNVMYGKPKIMVVGECVRHKEVYAYNSTLAGSHTRVIQDMMFYARSHLIPRQRYFKFCRELEQELENAAHNYDGVLISGETDEFGFFKLDNLDVESHGFNDIFIICQFSGGDYPRYTYKHRKVYSRYFGALISQTKFTHLSGSDSEEGAENTMPVYFTPPADISGMVSVTAGNVSDVFHIFSHYQYGLSEDVAYFSYCINRYTTAFVEEAGQLFSRWCAIGHTGYIWAELDNNRVSNLFEFEVTEAFLKPRPHTDTEGNTTYSASLCGIEGADSHDNVDIKLEYIPFEDSMRETAPPSAMLFRSPIRPKDFFKTDWILDGTYRYTILENVVGSDPVFPAGIGAKGGLNVFVEKPPYSVEHQPGMPQFYISKVGGSGSSGTVAVMAYITDENGCIFAAAATKMLLYGHRINCRSVDIKYVYGADASASKLEPSTGFATWQGAPTVGGDDSGDGHKRHVRSAPCGDHDCAPANCIGPMWFPYNDCTTMLFYDVANGAQSCTMPITEGMSQLALMGKAAWRYCTADEYQCWVGVGGNWASACGTSFTYYYSRAVGSMEFIGSARRVGRVNKAVYYAYGWAMPPFGNHGREVVERWLIRDYASFFDLSRGEPIPRSEYMPLVLDREDLAADIDCFKYPGISSHQGLSEPFFHRSMLSNYMCSWISESSVGPRLAFEDAVEVEYHGNCMYPWPAMPGKLSFVVKRYKFKNEDFAWLWPEYWKDIERNLLPPDRGTRSLKFLTLEKPLYLYDLNKVEHRLITSEGDHTVMFKPPEGSGGGEGGEGGEGESEANEGVDDEGSEGGEGGKHYACVCLDGVHWRSFKILYKDYSEGFADWQDESADGAVGGSGGLSGGVGGADVGEEPEGGEGGDGGGSIYESANNGKDKNGKLGQDPIWLHDFDTIFDSDASGNTSDDRKAFLGLSTTGEEIYGYYNRGLIAKIPKSKLNQLPMRELNITGEYKIIYGDFKLGYPINENVALHWVAEDLNFETPTRLVIKGQWGIFSYISEGLPNRFCLPGVECGESESEPADTENPEFPKSIYTLRPVSGDMAHYFAGWTGFTKDTVADFEIEVKFSTYPNRILFPPAYFQVRLTHFGFEPFKINSIELYSSRYEKAEESIKVWERKYHVSYTSGIADVNADGPDTRIFRTYDMDGKNAGQYFPATKIEELSEGGTAMSKMTIVACGKYYGEDEVEELDVGISTLKQLEFSAQRDLYTAAYDLDAYDVVHLGGLVPPDLSYFCREVLRYGGILWSHSCTLTDQKIGWDDLAIKKAFTQKGEFFQPGGHWFEWSSKYEELRCYLIGPVKKVYSVNMIHEKHGSGGAGGGVPTYNAHESYVGWTRLNYYEGRYWNLKSLGQSEKGQPTDLMTRAVFYSSPAQTRA